jgi:serine/threonine-protein kinase RsbW
VTAVPRSDGHHSAHRHEYIRHERASADVPSVPLLPLPRLRNEIGCWVVRSVGELRSLRAALAGTVRELTANRRHDEFLSDNVIVAASELTTNALVHGRPSVTVRLYRAGDHVILDVADHHPAVAPYFPIGRAPGAGGLGLKLVRDSSVELAYYVAGAHKHVWAQFTV